LSFHRSAEAQRHPKSDGLSLALMSELIKVAGGGAREILRFAWRKRLRSE